MAFIHSIIFHFSIIEGLFSYLRTRDSRNGTLEWWMRSALSIGNHFAVTFLPTIRIRCVGCGVHFYSMHMICHAYAIRHGFAPNTGLVPGSASPPVNSSHRHRCQCRVQILAISTDPRKSIKHQTRLLLRCLRYETSDLKPPHTSCFPMVELWRNLHTTRKTKLYRHLFFFCNIWK